MVRDEIEPEGFAIENGLSLIANKRNWSKVLQNQTCEVLPGTMVVDIVKRNIFLTVISWFRQVQPQNKKFEVVFHLDVLLTRIYSQEIKTEIWRFHHKVHGLLGGISWTKYDFPQDICQS